MVGCRDGVLWTRAGGLAGEDGAVLELEDVFDEEVLGVVVALLPEETVDEESDVGKPVWWFDVGTGCWVWSVGINGVLSSVVGVGGATLDGPGWEL